MLFNVNILLHFCPLSTKPTVDISLLQVFSHGLQLSFGVLATAIARRWRMDEQQAMMQTGRNRNKSFLARSIWLMSKISWEDISGKIALNPFLTSWTPMPLTHRQTTLEGDIRRFVRVNGELIFCSGWSTTCNLAPLWAHCLFTDKSNGATYKGTSWNLKL